MTDDNKNAAKIIEVAAEAIDQKCQTILNLAPVEGDLQEVPAVLRQELLRRFAPPSGPIGDIRLHLRELRRVAESLRAKK
jgi:hypothetical protein